MGSYMILPVIGIRPTNDSVSLSGYGGKSDSTLQPGSFRRSKSLQA